MACEEIDVQDQQVSAKFATAQSRRRVEQSVQSVVGIHGSRFHSKEVGPGETNNICRNFSRSRAKEENHSLLKNSKSAANNAYVVPDGVFGHNISKSLQLHKIVTSLIPAAVKKIIVLDIDCKLLLNIIKKYCIP